MDKFVKECFVKNAHHFQVLDVWEDLKVGTVLSLIYDKQYPKEAKVMFNNQVIGFISEVDSKLIIDILECKHDDIFNVRVAYKDEKNEENKRIKVVIYIKEKN